MENLQDYQDILDQKQEILNTQKKLLEHLRQIEEVLTINEQKKDLYDDGRYDSIKINFESSCSNIDHSLLKVYDDSDLYNRIMKVLQEYKQEKTNLLKKSILQQEEGDNED